MDAAGYVTLTRQSGLMREMELIANNIANASTAGFRREGVVFSEYVRRLDDAPSLSMAHASARHVDLTPGETEMTGAAFDFAIEGEGFFLVETPQGNRLTRAGMFTPSAEGELVNPDGLIADSIGPDGDIDPSEFTYNQGLAIQLRIERGLTAHARELADIFIREFAGDRFWTHAACFNAILCRALLRLDAVTESRTYESFVTDYADRLWRDARDDRGLFSGAGRYDAGYVLDHPAITGVLAALALDPAQRRTLL